MISRVSVLACLLAALLGLRADADPPLHPDMPAASDGRARPDAPDRNAACERCHADIAAEWRASLHRQAYTDASFAAALAREPIAFCRGCHAPEADPERPAPPALAHLGVGCVTCHTPNGDASTVLAAPRSNLSAETAPHPVRRLARFATADACANCHQFAFPGSRDLMQGTLAEHAASAYAATACAGCHMPVVGPADRRHRSHAFPASRDPAVLQQAVRTHAARDATRVLFTLTPGAVGHAFPTGDLFRRLSLTAEVVDVDGRSLATATRYLTRHFTRTRHEIADDRVGAPALAGGELFVAFDLGPPALGREIRWRLAYERVAFPRAGNADADVEAGIVVATGTLEP